LDIHLVDDGSTDGTWDLIRSLSRDCSALRATRFPSNQGRPSAGNYAIERATGKWVAILDADDWYEPERLERLIGAAESMGTEMAAYNQFLHDPATRTIVGAASPLTGAPKLLDLDSFQAGSDATRDVDFGMLKPVFLRDFLCRHQLRYYIPARRGQDYYMLLEFFAAGGTAIVLDQPFYHYVQPFSRLSRQWSSASRARYPFEAMRETNDHFYALFEAKFSTRQRCRLAARGRQLALMATVHRLREAFQGGDFIGAAWLLIRSFPWFWYGMAMLWARNRWRYCPSNRVLTPSSPLEDA